MRRRRNPDSAATAKRQRRAEEESPEVETLLTEARMRFDQSDLKSAWDRVSDALELDPQSSRAHAMAASVQLGLHDDESALDHYALAAHFNPDDWDSIHRRAQILDRRGDSGRAIAAIEAFLEWHPEHAAASYLLARAYYSNGSNDKALVRLRERLAIDPEDVAVLNLLGLILGREFGLLKEGEEVLRRALAISPGYLDATSNLGWVYSEQGRTAEALACFRTVLDHVPDDQETRLMRSYAHLRNGEFSEGWKDYEARHDSPLATKPRVVVESCNTLDSLAGKRIFVSAEQGLGDQIMFASCIGELLARTSTCTLECDPRLVNLFRRSFPSSRVVGRAPAEDGFAFGPDVIDCQIAMGSLPKLFRNNWSDFPMHSGYLRADPTRVSIWKKRLGELGAGPWIGISWRGGAPATRQQLRSIPLVLWREMLEKRAQFISLQYGDCEGDIRELERHCGLHVWHWPDVLLDIDETAALVVALSRIVSVCTAVVHLGGALGKPTMVLTPATPEWRYLAFGNRMPWYPSVTLYRQAQGEPWGNVLSRVSSAIPVDQD